MVSDRSRRGRRSIVGALFLILALAVTACGGGQDNSSSGRGDSTSQAVKDAQAAAEKVLAAPSGWEGPTSAPKPQPGKRLAIISCAQLTEGCNRPSRAAEDAAKRIGWQPTIFDGAGTADKQLAAIDSAVDAKYDAIILMLTDPSQVSAAVQRAVDAKIPVVTLGEPAYTDARKKTIDQIPDVSHDWVATGTAIGDYMIWKSDGKVDALLLHGSETVVVKYGQFKGTYEKLTDKQACPDCRVTVKEFTIAGLTTQPPALATAAVQADPAINWVWCYDFCLANASKALIAANLQEDIKGAGFDCNAENLQLIRDGKVQVVCIADPRDWEAWATVDIANRLMQGQKAVEQNIPVRLFDKSNLNELSPTDLKDGWQGGVDFRAKYLAIWGVQ